MTKLALWTRSTTVFRLVVSRGTVAKIRKESGFRTDGFYLCRTPPVRHDPPTHRLLHRRRRQRRERNGVAGSFWKSHRRGPFGRRSRWRSSTVRRCSPRMWTISTNGRLRHPDPHKRPDLRMKDVILETFLKMGGVRVAGERCPVRAMYDGIKRQT